MATPALDKYRVTEDDRDPGAVTRCCPDCERTQIGLDPFPGQCYYCAVCRSEWAVPAVVSGYWARQWRVSKASTAADLVWLVFMPASFLAVVAGIAYLHVTRGWAESPEKALGSALAGLIFWVAATTLAGIWYNSLLNVIRRAWTYVYGKETP